MSDKNSHPTHTDFEKLFVNNSALDNIQAYLNRFNPLDVMKISGQEIRHSNILGWLLDPTGTHGLGERFLKTFLAVALQGQHRKGSLSAMDIIQADLRDVEVLREYQNIDIFLRSRKNNFGIVIENKYHAKQHEGQLKKYINNVKGTFDSTQLAPQIKGIFLTLHDEEPEDPSYASIRYNDICEILPRVLEAEGSSLSTQVKIFIEHYIETIKEASGMSEELIEMEKLAKTIYRQNQKILDFIWKHGTSTEFNFALNVVFNDDDWQDKKCITLDNQKIVNLWNSSDMFSFLPNEWYQLLSEDGLQWSGCEKWWSGYPVICWIQLIRGDNNSGSVRLYAEVGPLSNLANRQALIESIKKVADKENLKDQISFQKSASEPGSKYSKFLKNNSQKIEDVQNVDQIVSAIKKLFEKFERCFKELSFAIEHFHSKIEK